VDDHCRDLQFIDLFLAFRAFRALEALRAFVLSGHHDLLEVGHDAVMPLHIGLKDVVDCSLPEFHELLMRHAIENIEFAVPQHLERCRSVVLLQDLKHSLHYPQGYRISILLTLLSLYFSARSDCELTS